MPSALNILIADDDKTICYTLDRALSDKGHSVTFSFTGKECLQVLKQNKFDAVLLDLIMPDMDGIDILRYIKENYPVTEVITISGMGSMRTALGTLNLNAFDFLPKPIHINTLYNVIDSLEKKLEKNIELTPISTGSTHSVPNLIGQSEAINKIRAIIDKISPSNSNVLIRGETGTGKEVVAHLIHNKSDRKNGPFIAINCSALPDSLLESELFGHEKGAFTDAASQKKGLLEVANRGTLFLDEIGEISPYLQAKLLRVVETKSFRRLGSTKEQSVNVRILSATNRNLEAAVKNGQFREDLFYRLRVISLHLSPLRERSSDISLLVDHFLNTLAVPGKISKKMEEETLNILMSYPWPGNVRELYNVIEHAIVFSDRKSITVSDLPPHIQQVLPQDDNDKIPQQKPTTKTLKSIEKNHIEKVLHECENHRIKTAKILGISEKALSSKLKKYKISV